MLQSGAEFVTGFSLPQHILKEDPSSNIMLHVDFADDNPEPCVFQVTVNDRQIDKNFYVCD